MQQNSTHRSCYLLFQDKALAAKLSTAQLKFRRFLLSMIASKTQQEAYFKEEYDREYGQDFRVKYHIFVKYDVGGYYITENYKRW